MRADSTEKLARFAALLARGTISARRDITFSQRSNIPCVFSLPLSRFRRSGIASRNSLFSRVSPYDEWIHAERTVIIGAPKQKLYKREKSARNLCVKRKSLDWRNTRIKSYYVILEKHLCVCCFFFSSLFAFLESPNERTVCRRTTSSASESFAFWAPERASRELRRLCLALTRFYTKIKQIRALDFVEVV